VATINQSRINLDKIGVKVDNGIFDIQSGIDGESIFFDNSIDSLIIIRHSCAHLMAQAIREIYQDTMFFVGPVIEDGFYYDMKISEKITEDDFSKIEKKMQEIVSKKLDITKYELTKEEAIQKFNQDEMKQEVIKNIPSSTLTIYKQGDFEDLCRGPHLPNTKYLKFCLKPVHM
jgi:threonyl-tRNA synthetase